MLDSASSSRSQSQSISTSRKYHLVSQSRVEYAWLRGTKPNAYNLYLLNAFHLARLLKEGKLDEITSLNKQMTVKFPAPIDANTYILSMDDQERVYLTEKKKKKGKIEKKELDLPTQISIEMKSDFQKTWMKEAIREDCRLLMKFSTRSQVIAYCYDIQEAVKLRDQLKFSKVHSQFQLIKSLKSCISQFKKSVIQKFKEVLLSEKSAEQQILSGRSNNSKMLKSNNDAILIQDDQVESNSERYVEDRKEQNKKQIKEEDEEDEQDDDEDANVAEEEEEYQNEGEGGADAQYQGRISEVASSIEQRQEQSLISEIEGVDNTQQQIDDFEEVKNKRYSSRGKEEGQQEIDDDDNDDLEFEMDRQVVGEGDESDGGGGNTEQGDFQILTSVFARHEKDRMEVIELIQPISMESSKGQDVAESKAVSKKAVYAEEDEVEDFNEKSESENRKGQNQTPSRQMSSRNPHATPATTERKSRKTAKKEVNLSFYETCKQGYDRFVLFLKSGQQLHSIEELKNVQGSNHGQKLMGSLKSLTNKLVRGERMIQQMISERSKHKRAIEVALANSESILSTITSDGRRIEGNNAEPESERTSEENVYSKFMQLNENIATIATAKRDFEAGLRFLKKQFRFKASWKRQEKYKEFNIYQENDASSSSSNSEEALSLHSFNSIESMSECIQSLKEYKQQITKGSAYEEQQDKVQLEYTLNDVMQIVEYIYPLTNHINSTTVNELEIFFLLVIESSQRMLDERTIRIESIQTEVNVVKKQYEDILNFYEQRQEKLRSIGDGVTGCEIRFSTILVPNVLESASETIRLCSNGLKVSVALVSQLNEEITSGRKGMPSKYFTHVQRRSDVEMTNAITQLSLRIENLAKALNLVNRFSTYDMSLKKLIKLRESFDSEDMKEIEVRIDQYKSLSEMVYSFAEEFKPFTYLSTSILRYYSKLVTECGLVQTVIALNS